MPFGDLNQIGPVAGSAVSSLEAGVQQIAPLLKRVSPFLTLMRLALLLKVVLPGRRKKKPPRRGKKSWR